MDDPQLVRYLDGALAPLPRWRLRRHLADCADCEQRLRRLETRSAQFGALLAVDAHAPPPVPLEWLAPARAAERRVTTARISPRSALAAAAVLLLALLLVPPVWAVVREWVGARLGPAGGTEQPAASVAAVPMPTAPHAQDPSAVRFVPGGERLTVVFAAGEPGAVLEIGVTDGALVILEASAGTSSADQTTAPVVVMPESVQVRNTGRANGVYRLWVPSTVRDVRVRVAGRGLTAPRDGGRVALDP